MVFHDQNVPINELSNSFKQELIKLGFKKPYFHAGQILRNEEEFKALSKEQRKRSFNKMTVFIKKLPITYTVIKISKKGISSQLDLILKLHKALTDFIKSHLMLFQSYDIIKIYYDNGQNELSKILKAVFEVLFNNIEEDFNANPVVFNLFQVADALSTFELVSQKYDDNTTSKIEKEFFGKEKRYLKKNFISKFSKKRI